MPSAFASSPAQGLAGPLADHKRAHASECFTPAPVTLRSPKPPIMPLTGPAIDRPSDTGAKERRMAEMIGAEPTALGRRAAVGGMLMAGARLITRLVDLMTMLVLARILRPADFGLVATAMSLVAVAEAILEMPLSQALLRLSDIGKAQYDTAFTLSLLRGIVLGLLLAMAAWPFAAFYDDGRLVPLVCVLSIAPIARGLSSPRLAGYQKHMSFWRDFAAELAGKSVAFGVALATVLASGSYWAIAAGSAIYPLATTVGSYVLAPYRPRLTLSELPVFSEMVGWMSAAQVMSALNWQFERLLIAKVMSTSQLGLFTASNDIASIPFLMLFGPVLRPLLAAFALLRGNRHRLARSYQTASCAVITIGLPLLVGESLVAEPAVRLILGERWLDAVPLVRWLALSLIPALFTMPAISLFMSLGRTNIFLCRSAIELGVKLPVAVIGTLKFGLAGIIAAHFLSELAADTFSMTVVKRMVGLTIREQVSVSWRSAASTAVMVPFVVLCLRHVDCGGGPENAAAALVAAGAVGAATYCLSLFGLWQIAGRPQGFEAHALGGAYSLIGKLSR
jgi:PST family polysaccharide transporter